MRPPEGFEWLIILLIVVLLFGYKKLPDAARGIGRSVRILRAETRGLAEDEAVAKAAPAPVQPLPADAPAQAEKPLH